MVICAVVGCGNRSKRDKNKSFFQLPSVLTHKGTETESLSRKIQESWLVRIRKEDISAEQYYNIPVCLIILSVVFFKAVRHRQP